MIRLEVDAARLLKREASLLSPSHALLRSGPDIQSRPARGARIIVFMRYQTFVAALVLVGILLSGAQMAAAQSDEEKNQQTLYNRLGGLAPISVVVDDFINAMVPDPFLNQNPAIAEARKPIPAPYLKFQATARVCQATGGPCQYVGRGMKSSHAHLNITEEEWDRMVDIFKQVLAKQRVPGPEQQELLEIIYSTRSNIVTAGTR